MSHPTDQNPEPSLEVIPDVHSNEVSNTLSQPLGAAPGGTPDPQPDPANPNPGRKRSGGPAFHKPGCGCRPCSARRRQAEALAIGSGPAPIEAPDLTPAKTEPALSDLPAAPVSRMKANVAAWLKMKMADPQMSDKDIAGKLGISPSTLHNTLYKAKKEGWVKFEDPLSEVRYGHLPLIAENLELFLKTRDKQVTIEAAKATLWKDYAGPNTQTGTTGAPMVFALKIELPVGLDTSRAASNVKGIIVGNPVGFQTKDSDIVDATVVKDQD